MAAARGMGPKQVAKFVAGVCAGDMRAARVASLANAVAGTGWSTCYERKRL